MSSHQDDLPPSPTIDLLLKHSFPEVASAIRSNLEGIMCAWEKAVLADLPADRELDEIQLRDHLPQILKLIADLLAEDDPDEVRRLLDSPSQHGTTRFNQNYDTRQFIIEYRLLRRVLVRESEATLGRRLETSEDQALDMAIDDMLQRGVVIFVNRQEARLRSAAEAEKKYLSFLSHDLRNNLNLVTLELELLKQRLAGSAEFADDASNLDSTQHSILETIDGMDRLLQAERLRRAVEPKLSEVSLHELAAGIVHQFSSRAAKKNVKLLVDTPPEAVIHTDREWLTLALQNLLGNAVKYSFSGTIRVGATCQHDPPASRWTVWVSDQGPGIAPEKLSHIFEAFRRGEAHGQEGVGLGLAIASQAAKLLGGELTVESQPGVGSTFSLVLPEKTGEA